MNKHLSIDFDEVIPKYYQIEKHIKSIIASGKIKAGDKLPSEEILSKQWDLNRWTVNKAINHLVDEGILYRNRGQGTFVTPYKLKNTRTLAVVLYHIDNPFYSKIVRGIEEKASEKGYHLILCNSLGDEKKEKTYVKQLIDDEKVDGFLLCPRNLNLTSPVFEMLEEKNIPVVVFPQAGEKKNSHNINYVVTDDRQGAYDAVKYLTGLGHSKIGFITAGNWTDRAILDRWNGYKKAMAENGSEVSEDYVIETPGIEMEDGWNAAEEKAGIIKKFTAVFCVGDMLAIGLLKRLNNNGIRVPEDLSIVGFDNIDMAGYPDVQLTTVEQPTHLIGQKATEILIQNIEGKAKKTVYTVLPTKLIVRKTTAKPGIKKVLSKI